MFTGLVEEVGSVRALDRDSESAVIQVAAQRVLAGTELGDSISVNGVCLTVVARDDEGFSADVMAETLARSTLGELREGTPVNLERAVRADTRLGGHIVQGHVDGQARVIAKQPAEHWTVLTFATSPELAKYLAVKGSVALNGVSLTVADVDDTGDEPAFSVSLIPATLSETQLSDLDLGDRVNVEVDVIAKYVERLIGSGRS